MTARAENRTKDCIMTLPDGLRQDGEGIMRCLTCGGEVVRCRGQDGAVVWVTPMGAVHDCAMWEAIVERAMKKDG